MINKTSLISLIVVLLLLLPMAGCGGSSKKSNKANLPSDFDEELLKTNDHFLLGTVNFPINYNWADSSSNNDKEYNCYYYDVGSEFTVSFYEIENFTSPTKDIIDVLEDDNDVKSLSTYEFDVFENSPGVELTYIQFSDSYNHDLEFSHLGDYYSLSVSGNKKYKKYIDKLYDNIIDELEAYTSKDGLDVDDYEDYESYDDYDGYDDYDSYDDYDNYDDYDSYDDYGDYEEEETTAATKPKNITDGKTLIYSDDCVNIYFDDIEMYEYGEGEFLVHYIVKNKTNIQLTFQADTLTLDGISYNSIMMSDPVAPNSTGIIEATVEGEINNMKPKSVGIGFIYFDNDHNTTDIIVSDVKIK